MDSKQDNLCSLRVRHSHSRTTGTADRRAVNHLYQRKRIWMGTISSNNNNKKSKSQAHANRLVNH
eukprot:JP439999.1.p3 GENE.JP439999.1~~JP439999.1.p3  ORF type:complete len:65 (+),score=0.67 JP439999.1:174-368(+)